MQLLWFCTQIMHWALAFVYNVHHVLSLAVLRSKDWWVGYWYERQVQQHWSSANVRWVNDVRRESARVNSVRRETNRAAYRQTKRVKTSSIVYIASLPNFIYNFTRGFSSWSMKALVGIYSCTAFYTPFCWVNVGNTHAYMHTCLAHFVCTWIVLIMYHTSSIFVRGNFFLISSLISVGENLTQPNNYLPIELSSHVEILSMIDYVCYQQLLASSSCFVWYVALFKMVTDGWLYCRISQFCHETS